MDDKKRDHLEKIWLPLGSILLSLGITVGGAYIHGKLQAALMEERVSTIQRDMARHELEKSEQITRNRQRGEDHEQRIVRLETNFGAIQSTLQEVRGDIKTLLRGMK